VGGMGWERRWIGKEVKIKRGVNRCGEGNGYGIVDFLKR